MNTGDLSRTDAKRTWRNLEAVHGMIYFTSFAPPEYAKAGVTKNRTGYFASRAEFRGDGHIAALVMEELSGLDALVSHAASGDVPAAALQATRAYTDDEWAAGVESMAARGLVHPDGTFTEAGRAQRDRIEAATDRLAVAPWAALGPERCDHLRTFGKLVSRRVVDAGLMVVDPSRFAD